MEKHLILVLIYSNKSVEDLVKGLSEFFDNAKYKIIDQNNNQHMNHNF